MSKFKTIRHMETVRNYINAVILKLMERGEQHDQAKLQSPEVEIFDIYTPMLRATTYRSKEYEQCIKDMKLAVDHHNAIYSHHPEHFKNGIRGMDLLDLIEMMCDWKSASMRHADGDIKKSVIINQERFGYSDDLKEILLNTVREIEGWDVKHFANES